MYKNKTHQKYDSIYIKNSCHATLSTLFDFSKVFLSSDPVLWTWLCLVTFEKWCTSIFGELWREENILNSNEHKTFIQTKSVGVKLKQNKLKDDLYWYSNQ